MAISYNRHKFDVDQYLRIAAAGALLERRTELIDGAIVDVTPQGPLHASLVARLSRTFSERVGPHAIIWAQLPIALRPRSMPEPDIALLRPREDYYAAIEVTPQDVLLVVEVASASLRFDRSIKARLYAAYTILDYWIIDAERRAIGIHRSPSDGAYKSVTWISEGTLTPLALPDIRLEVAEIFSHLCAR